MLYPLSYEGIKGSRPCSLSVSRDSDQRIGSIFVDSTLNFLLRGNANLLWFGLGGIETCQQVRGR